MQEELINQSDMERINSLSLEPLAPEMIHTRSMYLCSDQICETDWGQFSLNALRQIAERVVGEAVLCGHDKTSLPIGRFYRAELVERPGPGDGPPEKWVRAWFYWLKSTNNADDLARNIDGGIYREVSISWRFQAAECSICGGNIKICGHTPGRLYKDKRCTFLIDRIVDVLEGSIVYRAADRKACLEGARGADSRRAAPDRRIITLCRFLRETANGSARALVYPAGGWLEAVSLRLGYAPGSEAQVRETVAGKASQVLLDLSGAAPSDLSNTIRLFRSRCGSRASLFCCRTVADAEPVDSAADALVTAMLNAGAAVECYRADAVPDGLWVSASGTWEE